MALIPIQTDLVIEKFSGTDITETSSNLKNVIFNKHADGTLYATQRPSFDIFSDASAVGEGDAGRAIYRWGRSGFEGSYFINDTDFFKNDYDTTPISTAIAAGATPCKIVELNNKLLILNPGGNEAFSYDGVSFDKDDSTSWTDETYFPTQNNQTLVPGAVVLDGTCYVMESTGTIIGSDLNDITSWSDVTNFITAEKEPDIGVGIAKHKDNVVAFGARTIEFFYNAGYPVGSPLGVRNDISHNIGCADGYSIASDGDALAFVGITNSGAIGVYFMENFQPVKVSTPSVDSYLTTAIQQDGASVVGELISTGGHLLYILTLYNEQDGMMDTQITIGFDLLTKTASTWEHADEATIPNLPIVGWTNTTSSYRGEGILSNGDVVSILDDFYPHDTTAATGGYVTTYYSVTGTGATGDVNFNNATSDITSVTSDLSGFDDGDQIDVTGTTAGTNDGSFIVSGTPTSTDLNTTVAPTNQSDQTATITRDFYVDEDYFSSTDAEGSAIHWLIRLDGIDMQTRRNKIMDELRLVTDEAASTENVLIKWSDDKGNSFNSGVNIDISSTENKLTGMGRFVSRSFELTGTNSEAIRIDGLDVYARPLRA